MNREDIIRMAREAKLTVQEPSWGYSESYHFAGFEEYFVHFVALVAAAEREACAVMTNILQKSGVSGEHLADAIRARGQS